MPKRSRHQESIIKNYYQNRESIALQRAQEIVTELYLSQGKKRERHWKSLAGHLEKLGLDSARIQHLIDKDDPQLAAKTIKRLWSES